MRPDQVASILTVIANRIMASRRPDRRLVIAAIKRVIHDVEPYGDPTKSRRPKVIEVEDLPELETPAFSTIQNRSVIAVSRKEIDEFFAPFIRLYRDSFKNKELKRQLIDIYRQDLRRGIEPSVSKFLREQERKEEKEHVRRLERQLPEEKLEHVEFDPVDLFKKGEMFPSESKLLISDIENEIGGRNQPIYICTIKIGPSSHYLISSIDWSMLPDEISDVKYVENGRVTSGKETYLKDEFRKHLPSLRYWVRYSDFISFLDEVIDDRGRPSGKEIYDALHALKARVSPVYQPHDVPRGFVPTKPSGEVEDDYIPPSRLRKSL